MITTEHPIAEQFNDFISQQPFPCVIAKDSVKKGNARIMVTGHMACPANDHSILDFIYTFVDELRNGEKGFHTAVVIFDTPGVMSEEQFEALMWQRLGSLRRIDAENFSYDERVSADVDSSQFSFSLKKEAFFVLGMHPGSSRAARKFSYPTLVFNAHQQFEEMKKTGAYDKTKAIVRKRDLVFSGSINPMLADFGDRSEVFQYSGMAHDENWECPMFKQKN